MEFKIHNNNNRCIAELITPGVCIRDVQDAVDLLGNASYQEAQNIIIRKENLSSDFFELKTGFAGEILQKFSNYRMKLAIVGDFSEYKSKSLNDFIYESNKQGLINFMQNVDEAIRKLSEK